MFCKDMINVLQRDDKMRLHYFNQVVHQEFSSVSSVRCYLNIKFQSHSRRHTPGSGSILFRHWSWCSKQGMAEKLLLVECQRCHWRHGNHAPTLLFCHNQLSGHKLKRKIRGIILIVPRQVQEVRTPFIFKVMSIFISRNQIPWTDMISFAGILEGWSLCTSMKTEETLFSSHDCTHTLSFPKFLYLPLLYQRSTSLIV